MQKHYILTLLTLVVLLITPISAMPGVGVSNAQLSIVVNGTIDVNDTFTLPYGTPAYVNNVGSSGNIVLLDFGIPEGSPGNGTGTAGTIAVNYTFTLPPGSSASVTNIGTLINAIFDFGIPKGDKGDTGAAGYTPVKGVDYFDGINGTNGIGGVNGTNGINGINGTSATVAINYTFTGLPGTEANITNVGNSTDALWDITIPQGVTGDAGATGATGGTGGQILYFRNSASIDPITYEGLIPVPKGATEVDENVTVKSNRVLVDSYITDIGYPGVTEYPAGLWRFRTFHYVNSASGNTNAVFEVYNRTAGGTETLLFTAVSEDINALTVTEYLTSYVQTTAYPVALTDRIVVKVYGQTDHASNIIFHWVYEGSTHTSHIQTTLASSPDSTLSFNVIAGETLY